MPRGAKVHEEYKISAWTPGDIPEIHALYKDSGQPFFTDPRDARNMYTLIARDEGGSMVAVLTGRITVELMLVVRPNAVAPLAMLAAIYSLWDKMKGWLWQIGIADVHAPVFSHHKTFYEIMKRVGFKDDDRMNLTYDIRKDMENGK